MRKIIACIELRSRRTTPASHSLLGNRYDAKQWPTEGTLFKSRASFQIVDVIALFQHLRIVQLISNISAAKRSYPSHLLTKHIPWSTILSKVVRVTRPEFSAPQFGSQFHRLFRRKTKAN